MRLKITPQSQQHSTKLLDECREILRCLDIEFDNNTIRSGSRRAHIVFVRGLIAILLREKGYSTPLIGLVINRDHATVLHLCKREYKEWQQQIIQQALSYVNNASNNDLVSFYKKKIKEYRQKIKELQQMPAKIPLPNILSSGAKYPGYQMFIAKQAAIIAGNGTGNNSVNIASQPNHNFKDEDACIKHLAAKRWQGNITCPHCGAAKPYVTNRGYRCAAVKKCGKKFTVRTGTIFEGTKLPLSTWFAAMQLIKGHHKNGGNSRQLARELRITQKSAWLVLHRLRQLPQQQINDYITVSK